MIHQYIERETREIRQEILYQDTLIQFLYTTAREKLPLFYKAVTSKHLNSLLAFLSFETFVGKTLLYNQRLIKQMGIDLSECLEPAPVLNTPKSIFQRKIRYWECRPMDEDHRSLASPVDGKLLLGSLNCSSLLYIKEKFFELEELLLKRRWVEVFKGGDLVICRLTPEKYHYVHMPTTGVAVDFYETDGSYHSCNPLATITLVTPFSKNKRAITIIDTDVKNGSHMGFVGIIEVAALMIGGIKQCYSDYRYDNPKPITIGMYLKKGQPKSLFMPGSSTVVLLFQPNKVKFSEDLVQNMKNNLVLSRYTTGFGIPLAETDTKVRSTIGKAIC